MEKIKIKYNGVKLKFVTQILLIIEHQNIKFVKCMFIKYYVSGKTNKTYFFKYI